MITDEDRVTAAAVARRVGVGRAAVSNWLRRYPDFPRPVEGLFVWPAVRTWLVANGKAGQLTTRGRTDTGTQRVDAAPGTGSAPALVPQEQAVADLGPRQLLARAMVALLPLPEPDGAEPPVVIDPACGTGGFLLAAADHFGGHATLLGQEPDEAAGLRAAEELRNHPQSPPYDVIRGDSLRDDRLRRYRGAAAGVVCVPPADTRLSAAALPADDPRWRFGTPEVADVELAWVQLCVALLRPRGMAVVLVSTAVSVRSSGRTIRAALVRAGALQDVIALPRELVDDSRRDACLWVLRPPQLDAGRSPVRMLDLSELADPAQLPDDPLGWDRLLDTADNATVRAVPRVELLDGDTDLRPTRHLHSLRSVTADDLLGLTQRLQLLYAHVGDALPRPISPSVRRSPSTVTVAELERAGALAVRPRDTTSRAGDVLLRTLGRPPVVARGTAADEVGVTQVVEIDPARLDPHFVALFLRTEIGAAPVSNTLGVLSRDDLRRCRLPRLPLAEQHDYGTAFRHLTGLQDVLAALATTSSHLLEQIIHGLTSGALLPDPPRGRGSIAGDPTESETQ